ncbi:hypothetical protein ACFFRR_005565 [Megaselia abdita]
MLISLVYNTLFWKIVSLIILSSASKVCCVWKEPYFKESNTDGVKLLEPTSFMQPINVTEEIPWPFDLAVINYDGSKTPYIEDFTKSILLNATVEKKEGKWTIVVHKRQDYENPSQRVYLFNVVLGEGSLTQQHQVRIGLFNIFDNNPSVSYEPVPCKVEELRKDYTTNCEFNVYDPDGMLNNNISLNVLDNTNTFDFVHVETLTYNIIFNLIIKEELSYVQRSIYNLNVTAYDIAANTGSTLTILEIIPVPHLEPKWTKPLPYAGFQEKSRQQFTVIAIDGDTGINQKICYSLVWSSINYSSLITLESLNGEGMLSISPIDRDTLQQEIFQFDIKAYKCNNETSFIQTETIFFVEDINDHYPEIEIVPETVFVLENKFITIPFEKFIISDLDLGIHATYNVSLLTNGDISYWEVFDLIPDSGYQINNFQLSIRNATPVDYEDDDWREFKLHIVSREIGDTTHSRTKEVNIKLLNWNDELPIFDKSSYSMQCLETVGNNFTFEEIVHASDRDIDDFTLHEIMGTYPGLKINNKTGAISTVVDKAFDYEQQTTVILQVKAFDNLINKHSSITHSTFTQVTISVIDVNDKTPEIRLPITTVNIVENSIGMSLLTDAIEGRDPDSNAFLKFTINWDKTYATKFGQPTNKEKFQDCFIIQTYKTKSLNLVKGHLLLNPEFAASSEIDYESFDTVFITLTITDHNQEINSNSSQQMLTIRLLDVNDNAPEFIENTLDEIRQVVEEASVGALVGTILAIDNDGIGNNEINYFINSRDIQTADGLIGINLTTGVMKVLSDKIDCDLPFKIFFLEYSVILTDGIWETQGSIQVRIQDINNKEPIIVNDKFEQQISIYENETSGFWIQKIYASDADRDSPHCDLRYMINFVNSPELQNLFNINITTGDLSVNLVNNAYLDRDNGIEYHVINIIIEDNYLGYGPVFTNHTYVNVTLLDINDNAPEMPAVDSYHPVFEEDSEEGFADSTKLIAPDKDDPNLPNSWVLYEILDISPGGDNIYGVEDYENLFKMVGDGKVYGQMVANKNLRGYYGTWRINISAYDQGIPQQKSNATYFVVVKPHNFHPPQIVFPIINQTIRLCSEQNVNQSLKLVDCSTYLQPLEAYDPDGGVYGDISFYVESYNESNNFKTVKDQNFRNKSTLQLKEKNEPGVYQIELKAEDGGYRFDVTTLKIVLVDLNSIPFFEETSLSMDFTENKEGLQEVRKLHEAKDPKNEGVGDEEDLFRVYYFIDRKFLPEDNKFFILDKATRELSLLYPLNRTSQKNHQLKIIATNDIDGLNLNSNTLNNILNLNVDVIIANPPSFLQEHYSGGITASDPKGKLILFVSAENPHKTYYNILKETIITYGENIEEYKNQMLDLDNETGNLYLSTSVKTSMKGYLKFVIAAYNGSDYFHNDTVPVTVYIIGENNRVKFEFLNEASQIEENYNYLRETLKLVYGYEQCNIDDVGERILESAVVITDVIVHFIDADNAVEASEIQQKSSDLSLISQLRSNLLIKGLFLSDVPVPSTSILKESKEKTFERALIITSIIFAMSLTILVGAFGVRTRALNKQLKAYELKTASSNMDQYGAPNTNAFSIQVSNTLNQQSSQFCEFGDSSTDSEDGDNLIGVNNDDTFKMDNDIKKTLKLSETTNNLYLTGHIPRDEDNSDDNGSTKIRF